MRQSLPPFAAFLHRSTAPGSYCYHAQVRSPAEDLRKLETPEAAAGSLPRFGPDWDAAIEHGIDVTLLLENAKETPARRIRRMDASRRFAAAVRRRTATESVVRELARRKLREKLEAFGPER